MSITLLLVIIAFGLTIVSAIGKCPLWIPVLLLCVAGLIGYWPLK